MLIPPPRHRPLAPGTRGGEEGHGREERWEGEEEGGWGGGEEGGVERGGGEEVPSEEAVRRKLFKQVRFLSVCCTLRGCMGE